MAVVVDSARRVRAKPGDLLKSNWVVIISWGCEIVMLYILSAVIALVYVGIEVDIGNESVE